MYKVLAGTADWDLFASAAQELSRVTKGERPTFTFRRAFRVYRELRTIARTIKREYHTASPEQHLAYRAMKGRLQNTAAFSNVIPGMFMSVTYFSMVSYCHDHMGADFGYKGEMLLAMDANVAMDEHKDEAAWKRIEQRAPEFAQRVRSRAATPFDPALAVEADEGDC